MLSALNLFITKSRIVFKKCVVIKYNKSEWKSFTDAKVAAYLSMYIKFHEKLLVSPFGIVELHQTII